MAVDFALVEIVLERVPGPDLEGVDGNGLPPMSSHSLSSTTKYLKARLNALGFSFQK